MAKGEWWWRDLLLEEVEVLLLQTRLHFVSFCDLWTAWEAYRRRDYGRPIQKTERNAVLRKVLVWAARQSDKQEAQQTVDSSIHWAISKGQDQFSGPWDLCGGTPVGKLRFIFDGPPGPEGPRFIEVEDEDGKSISIGDWVDQGDGTWALEVER